jgi:hypothetical protein
MNVGAEIRSLVQSLLVIVEIYESPPNILEMKNELGLQELKPFN